jgi:hypothetical protein
MRKFTTDELHLAADEHVRQIVHPKNTDDPKWLWRWQRNCNGSPGKRKGARAQDEATQNHLTMRWVPGSSVAIAIGASRAPGR